MEILAFFTAPVLGGLIALSTNWLAIRMLFRPHGEIRFFGVKLPFTPGLIPKERVRIAKKLAEAISTKLLTPDVLAKELANTDVWQLPDITIGAALRKFDIQILNNELIGNAVDRLLSKLSEELKLLEENYPELDEKLKGFTEKVINENVGGFARMFVMPDKVYESIKNGLTEHLSEADNQQLIKEKVLGLANSDFINDMLSEKVLNVNIRSAITLLAKEKEHTAKHVFKQFIEYFAKNLPIAGMIENKIAEFDMAEAEEIILSVTGRELKVIVILGGVLGFVIGMLVNFL